MLHLHESHTRLPRMPAVELTFTRAFITIVTYVTSNVHRPVVFIKTKLLPHVMHAETCCVCIITDNSH